MVNPASCSIIGITGVNAKRPIPIATANAASPASAFASGVSACAVLPSAVDVGGLNMAGVYLDLDIDKTGDVSVCYSTYT